MNSCNLKMVVFNTAADSSGAISELHRFKDEAELACSGNTSWLYVLGLAELPEDKQRRVRSFSWTKKNWLFRMLFDIFWSRRIVREEKADFVVSLQNTTVACGKVPQILFVQLCFPFIKHRFPISDFRLWLHQNVIGYLSIRSIKRADLVVVQNEWMRKACAEKANVDESKIKVLKQVFVVPDKVKRFEPSMKAFRTFFYPATLKSYKNHRMLLEGAGLAKRRSAIDPKIVLTLDETEAEKVHKLKTLSISFDLDTEFRGSISREDVLRLYGQSILVFPSLLETVGLPLVEAKATGSIILAYDAEYSRDVLKNYSDAHFFNDANSLATLLARCMEGQMEYAGGIEYGELNGQKWAEIVEEFAQKTHERINI